MRADTAGEASPLAAAQAVAREHGVACDEAVRIAAGSNALVHLKPAPVVARVMTGTAVLHDDAERWLAREVAVGAFLAERTELVVPPSDILPPGPHEQDGLWMTLWKFVPHDDQAPPPEPRELGRSLRGLHAALADFPGDLAPLSGIRDWLERLLAELRPSPTLTQRDIDRLRVELDALTPAVFESSLPAQALHGDASLSNLLRTDSGLVWNDLEDVCIGPVAWDVAGLVASARARGHSARFVDELLAAYGEPGVEGLEAFLEAHALYDIVWQAFEARRRPRTRGWLNPLSMDAINRLDRTAFVERFGPLFEHSPWVAEAAWRDRPFADREQLYEALVAAMHAAPRERKLALIGAHPDLAGKAAIEGTLTDSSRTEQASAGLDRLTPDEYDAFTRTNAAYRERFGFPLVVCVREHTKESILRVAAERLANSEDEEIRVALEEIAKIARLRLEDVL